MKLFILTLLISQSSFAFFPKAMKNKIKNLSQLKHNSIKRGGAMDGGGSGASFPESGAAWFYADKTDGQINICIKRDPAFKASYPEITRSIKAAFQTWDKYIKASDIYDAFDEDGNPVPTPYPTNLTILTKINIQTNCTKKTDITFYLGLKDKIVQDVLDRMVKPKGFAYRNYDDIDAINGTSKGIVYIFSPTFEIGGDLSDTLRYDWSKPNRLQAMITHEVGHIMGLPHIKNTIMEENFDFLFYMVNSSQDTPIRTEAESYLTKVDHQKKVLFSNAQMDGVSGLLGIPGSQDEKDTFKFLTNKKLNGKAKITLSSVEGANFFELTVSDSLFSKTFSNLTFGTATNTTFDIGKDELFKRVRKVLMTPGSDWERYDYIRDFRSFNKFIIHTNIIFGKKDVAIDINVNFGSTVLKLNDENYWVKSPFTMHYYNPEKNQRKLLFAEKFEQIGISDSNDQNSGDLILNSSH